MADDNSAAAVPVGPASPPQRYQPCVGGLMRTWTESGATLWSVPSAEVLTANQGWGTQQNLPHRGTFQSRDARRGPPHADASATVPLKRDAGGTMSIPGYMIQP